MTKFEKVVYKNEFGEITFSNINPPLFIYSGEGFDGLEGDIVNNTNPYFDGVQVLKQNLKERTLTLTCYYIVYSEEERKEIHNKLYKLFNPKAIGDLYLYTTTSERKASNVIVVQAPVFDREIESNTLDKLIKFQISFLKPNPYFEDLEENKKVFGNKFNMLEFVEEIPVTEKMIYADMNPTVIDNFKNIGDSNCPIKVVFKASGKVKNPYVVNIQTQEFIKINKIMEVGEAITITTEQGNKRVESVVNKVKTNIFNDLDIDSTFLHLYLGDNWLRVGADENEEVLETTITYTNYWSGI